MMLPPIVFVLFPDRAGRPQKQNTHHHIQSRKRIISSHGADHCRSQPDNTKKQTKIKVTHKMTSIQISVLITAMAIAYCKNHFCAVLSMNGRFLSMKKTDRP